MIKSIYKRNACEFWISLIPVVIVGVMAPLRSYIMQLLIDSKSYRDLLEKCLIAAVFSIAVFSKLFYISAKQFKKRGLAFYLSKFMTDIRIILDDGINNIYSMIMQFVFVVVAVVYLFCVEPFILLIVAVSVIR